MRIVLTILLCLGIFFGNEVYAQQDSVKGKVEFDIKVDVLLPIISAFSNSQNQNSLYNSWVGDISFETSFAGRQSLQLEGFLVYENNRNTDEIIPEWKYYLSNKNPCCGFYTGLYLKYLRTQYSDIDYSYLLFKSYEWGLGAGGLIGYQNSFSEHFIFDLMIGIGYSKIIYGATNYPFYYEPVSNLDGIFGFSIGYKF